LKSTISRTDGTLSEQCYSDSSHNSGKITQASIQTLGVGYRRWVNSVCPKLTRHYQPTAASTLATPHPAPLHSRSTLAIKLQLLTLAMTRDKVGWGHLLVGFKGLVNPGIICQIIHIITRFNDRAVFIPKNGCSHFLDIVAIFAIEPD